MEAATIRENEILRKVAACAIRLREIGKACEQHDESLAKLWEERPDLPRSLTSTLMFNQAYGTAMKAFDEAVMEAAAAGFDWSRANPILGPSRFTAHPTQELQS